MISGSYGSGRRQAFGQEQGWISRDAGAGTRRLISVDKIGAGEVALPMIIPLGILGFLLFKGLRKR